MTIQTSGSNKGTAPNPAEILLLALEVCEATMELQSGMAATQNETLRVMNILTSQKTAFAALAAQLREQYAPAAVQKVSAEAEQAVSELRKTLREAGTDAREQVDSMRRFDWRLVGAIAVLSAALLAGQVFFAMKFVPPLDEVRERLAVMSAQIIRHSGHLWAPVMETRTLCETDDPTQCKEFVRISD